MVFKILHVILGCYLTKNTKWRRQLTESESNKKKVSYKMAKNSSKKKKNLFVFLYKTETCKASKFLLLSNLDCKKYIPSVYKPAQHPKFVLDVFLLRTS